jgi:CBS domain-containing protein
MSMNHPTVPTTRDFMTSRVVTLPAEMSALEAAEILVQNSISGAPVVDDEDRLLGLLSEYDCLRAVASAGYQMDAHDDAETVAELMVTKCHTVEPGLDLFGLAHEFVRLRVRRFPVLEDGRLVGQVSRRDALRAALRLRRELQRAHHDYPDYPEGRNPIRNYPRGR